MLKFRHRLTLLFLGLIGLSCAAAGLFTLSVVRESQVRALEDGLVRQMRVYLATVDWDAAAAGSVEGGMFRGEAARLSRQTGVRVTFYDADGKPLGDSAPTADAGEHGEPGGAGPPSGTDGSGEASVSSPPAGPPPEVEAARSGEAGVAVRRDMAGAAETMYVALPASFGKAGAGYLRFGESLAPLDAETRRLAATLGLGLLAILLVAAPIAYRISRSLTGPIEHMTRVAYQITNMNYRARVTAAGRDEIGQLGRAINKMSESMQYQMNQILEDEARMGSVLDNMTSGVVMVGRDGRIALMNRSAEQFVGAAAAERIGLSYTQLHAHPELKRMVAAAFQSREPLRGEVTFHFPTERTLDIHVVPMTVQDDDYAGIVVVMHDITAIRRLERMRSEFVANVSHELKTPIAAMQGFAETLLGGAADDPETARSFLRIIYEESGRLNRLISDILDLSEIESRRIALQFSPIELQSFFERLFHVLAPAAEKKNVVLEAEIAPGTHLEADEDRLRQIFMNLLSNGIAYSHEGGRVTVVAETISSGDGGDGEDERVRILVRDRGIGIPKNDLPRIFERFYRVDKARSRLSGGTGLGLSIAKHLVELHKGTIRAESEIGVGTTFIVELPVLQ